MSENNKEIMKEYPIFKLNIPEKCYVDKLCGIDDIKMEIVGTKIFEESYILQYHCNFGSILISALANLDLMTFCEKNKLPLDAFVISKSGMGEDLKNYQDEEMPATDYCSLKDSNTNEYITADCGKLLNGFPYTNMMIGYKLIPITDDNRESVYAEFKEKGFFYEKSQAEMVKVIESFLKNTELQPEPTCNINPVVQYFGKIAGEEMVLMGWSDWIPSAWSDAISFVIDNATKSIGSGVDCLTDLPHCLGFDI